MADRLIPWIIWTDRSAVPFWAAINPVKQEDLNDEWMFDLQIGRNMVTWLRLERLAWQRDGDKTVMVRV